MSPFEFHTGIDFEEKGGQFVGQCPFCEKNEKFYYNENNLWDCKNAECVDPKTRKRRSGNTSTFLRQIYDEFDTVTKGSKFIADRRKIPYSRVTALGIKYNPLNDSILIPTFRNGKINNIYKVVDKGGKLQILCTPGVEHTLFNSPETTEDTIWVCEGHFDRIAAEAIVPPGAGVTPIAVPGAGVWKRQWTDILADKHVVFCYDNDNSGKQGFEKVILKHIANSPQKPKSVNYLSWPDDCPDGYDLNDVYLERNRKSRDFIEANTEPYNVAAETVIVKSTPDTVEADKSIDTFDKFMGVFRDQYHVTDDMVTALLCTFSSIYSVMVGGEQLWFRVIGPPGCGKSTIASAVSASEQVVLRSTFTGLFSGWNDGNPEDAGMVPMIKGKSLIVKDADTLMQQGNIAKIFSELRDFYDKSSSVQYKNRMQFDYKNVRSTMILCGTNVLRRADQAFLGERFLDLEMRMTKEDEELIKRKVRSNAIKQALDSSNVAPDMRVQAAAKGFIEHLMERPMEMGLSDSIQDEIDSLATLASKMRTKVDRDAFGKGDVTFQPTHEIPSRLIGQLFKQAMCIPVITGANHEQTPMKVIRKLTKDIIYPDSNRYRISLDLMEDWFSRNDLQEATQIPKSTLNRELDDLIALRLVEEKKVPSNIPKHSTRKFTLREDIKEGLISLNKNDG